MAAPTPGPAAPSVEAWEGTFADGLAASSRSGAPWVAGHVHVVRDAPDAPEAVPTGGVPFHQLIVPLRPFAWTERVVGGPLHADGPLVPGEVVVISPERAAADTRATWRALDDGPMGIVSVMIEPEQVARALDTLGLSPGATDFLDAYPVEDPLLDGLVRTLGVELEAGGPGGRPYAEQLVQTAALQIGLRHASRRPHDTTVRGGLPTAALRRVEAYARVHLDDDVSLDDLAGAAGYSTFHFCRAFKEETGRTPARWLARLRMRRAAETLETADVGIASVAASVGYGNPSAFATAFRRAFGVSPSTYRREAGR